MGVAVVTMSFTQFPEEMSQRVSEIQRVGMPCWTGSSKK